ncbi:MAG: ATP-binding protein, partial [Candidatus Cloacimonadaceae bacterium]|nr:ATP-binding protein [Candidatus Cloacimonadaceae bacterium]
QAETIRPAKSFPKKDQKKQQLQKYILELIKHPLLEGYKLTQADVLAIADLWQYHLELPGRGIDWASICRSAKIRRMNITECFAYLTGLLERNIICFDEIISGNYYLNPVILQTGEFTLTKDIILRILGRDLKKDLGSCLKTEWQDNEDFFDDLKMIFDTCYTSFGELGKRFPILEYPILCTGLSLLQDRIHAAPDSLGIKALQNKYGLCASQLYIIMIVLYHQLCSNEEILEPDIIHLLAPDPRFRAQVQKLLSDDAVLIAEAIVCKELRYHKATVANLAIPQETMAALGYQTQNHQESKHKRPGTFFEKCPVEQSLAELIIPEPDKKLLYSIISNCKSEKRLELEKWGFTSKGSKQGTVLLLYGAPGTGKTYTAGAIANELNRDLLMLKVPELRNKFFGETEKLIKQAFRDMRDMTRDETNAPVFLLNEADQLIHNRRAGT